ncbi:MAG: SDR family oxidoreductase [Ignavibacteriales bacterium]|nr:SDR family oxidoreductase [Ignavibacteriales bacterium]
MTAKRALRRKADPVSWNPNKTALVTGASSGIGYDLASLLAQNGYNVILVARSKEKLQALAHQAREMFGVSAKVIAKDLSDPSVPAQIFKELKRENISVDVLINNAGFGSLGAFVSLPTEEQLSQIRLNVLALVHLTKMFLPAMVQQGRGHVLNVASTAGFQAGPLMVSYYATKAFVISFSVGLAHEVRRSGVSVSVLCPGPTATGFQIRAGIRRNPLLQFTGLDSRIVARAGYEGMMAGKTIIVPGVLNKLGTIVVRLFPMNFVARIVGTIQEKKRL